MPAAHRFIEHLAQAVRFKTVSYDDAPADPEELARLHRFFEQTYRRTWERLEVEVVGDSSLLISWEGRDPQRPGLLLLAHQDVVPVEPASESEWSRPPFAGASDGTYLYGRGTVDDKGPLIAILEVVEELLEEGFQPAARVTLALGDDEERSGAGAAAMADLLAARNQRFTFALDEGGAVTEDLLPGTMHPVALIAVGEKGYADVELTAGGEPGHSSSPPRRNAVGKLAAAIARIESHPMAPRLDVAAGLFEQAATAMRPALRPLARNLGKTGPFATGLLSRRPTTNALIRTTITPTIIDGGTKANVLPTRARAVLNVRTLPGDTTDDVLAHVRRHAGSDISIRVLRAHDPPSLADPDSEAFKLVARTVKGVFADTTAAPFVVMGATDARFYGNVADQVLRFQPFRLNEAEAQGIHGPDERVRISDAGPALAFYRQLIRQACG